MPRIGSRSVGRHGGHGFCGRGRERESSFASNSDAAPLGVDVPLPGRAQPRRSTGRLPRGRPIARSEGRAEFRPKAGSPGPEFERTSAAASADFSGEAEFSGRPLARDGVHQRGRPRRVRPYSGRVRPTSTRIQRSLPEFDRNWRTLGPNLVNFGRLVVKFGRILLAPVSQCWPVFDQIWTDFGHSRNCP